MLKKELLFGGNAFSLANYVIIPEKYNMTETPIIGWSSTVGAGSIFPTPEYFDRIETLLWDPNPVAWVGINTSVPNLKGKVYVTRLDTGEKHEHAYSKFLGYMGHAASWRFTEADVGKHIPLYIDLSEVLGGGGNHSGGSG